MPRKANNMDIIQIILIIGAVIAGLLILWAVIAGIFAIIAKKQFDKTTEKMFDKHDDFFNRNTFR